VRCYGFARALKRYNIDTEVFSFADSLGAKYGERELEMGVSEKIKFNIRALPLLWKKIDRDTVIFMQRLNYHTLTPFLISLMKNNKFIFDCDDWNIREYPVYYAGLWPSSKMEYLTKKIAKYSDVCIAASKFLDGYLSKYNPRIYYIPTGVDTAIFNPKDITSNAEAITFSWIGTAYHKEMDDNLKFIIEIFSRLADSYNTIYLSLAGEGEFLNKIKANLGTIRHHDRIMIHRWIHPDNIPAYLAGIDIGLLPLIQDTKFNRAKSPTKLFEYMAMAKPTIASAMGEARGIIDNGRSGFLAKDKEEFIDKMRALIEDKGLRYAMGRNARQTVEKHYSLEAIGGRLFAIINSLA